MPILSSNIKKDQAEMYQGYDSQKVGMGLLSPGTYASPSYQKKKIKKLIIGGIVDIVYAGMEHDTQPTILTMAYESQYNTILAYNLNYLPQRTRQAMLKYVLDSNANRIKNNQPLVVDYYALKRNVRISQYAVRRYKTVGINVVDTKQLIEWPEVVKKNSSWSNHYKQFMN